MNLPEGWRQSKLEDICNIQIGKTPSRSERRYWNGDLPWVSISDMSKRVVDETKEGITNVGASESRSSLIPKGTLLLSFKLSLGKRAFAGRDLYTNEAIAALEILDKEIVDDEFLYWALGAIDYNRFVDRAAKGKTLNKAKLKRIKLSLPSLDEQKRIAEVLDRAEALRARRRAALALLDELTQSIFLDMFGDPINPKCDIETLGDHVEFMTTGGRGWAKYYCEEGARFVRSLDVRMNHISDVESVFVNPPDSAEAKRTKVSAGHVLLTMTGSRIGRVSKAPDALDGSYISQHVAIVRLKESLEPEFLSRFLSLEHGGQIQIRKWQYGQTKPGLNFRQVKSFQVPVPNAEQQRAFVGIVEKIEKQKDRINARFDLMDELFASLQSRAFKGELFNCSREPVAAEAG